MGTLFQDLRYAIRMLLKKPAFTAVAVMTLALGIGANTAIFSVVNAVLLRPLSYKQPHSLVQIWETNPLRGWTVNVVAPANYLDWEKRNNVFEGLAAYRSSFASLYLTADGEPERIKGLISTGGLFEVLGVEAMLGRTFLPENTWQGNDRVVVLSYGLWKRMFGGNPEIIGQSISLSGITRTVVGVMPEGFYFPTRETELWVTYGWNPNQIATVRRPHMLRTIARLKPGVTVEQARAEMNSIMSALEQEYPDTNTKMGAGLSPLQDFFVEDTRPALLIFLAAVGFVLLIACANVANLLLARGAARSKEMAIRAALGARRGRIIRQLLTESLLLSIAGSGLGLLLAGWSKDLLLVLSPGNIPRIDEINLDGRVLVFTLGMAGLTAFIFGVAPAWQASKPDLTIALKEGGQKVAGSVQSRRARSLLVISEIALSMILVIGAGLMLKSFIRLQQVDPGFKPDKVLTFDLALPVARYEREQQATAFYKEALDRIKAIPGVESAGATSALALRGYNWTGDFSVEGRAPDDYGVEVRHKEITPDYFQTMGIPLERGRHFTEADTADSPPVVIVNSALARRHFKNEDPIGKRMKFERAETEAPWHTIVGVVGDEKQNGLGIEVLPEIYEPFQQHTQWRMTVAARTAGDPDSITGAVRSEIKAIDKDLPAFNFVTLDEVLHISLARDRFNMTLLAVFAAVALILSAVGIYGVISYSVTQRTHEIGIRMALGASSRDVLRLIIGQGMTLVLIGVAVGLAGAFALTRLMSSMLYGVSATDPITFIALSLLLSGVAALACYIPARRALKVDPMIALRYE